MGRYNEDYEDYDSVARNSDELYDDMDGYCDDLDDYYDYDYEEDELDEWQEYHDDISSELDDE